MRCAIRVKADDVRRGDRDLDVLEFMNDDVIRQLPILETDNQVFIPRRKVKVITFIRSRSFSVGSTVK